MTPTFPSIIETRLGALRLEEFKIGKMVCRHYEPERPLPVSERGTVKLIVWPPSDGVASAVKLGEFVERQWDAITARLDQILQASESTVDEGIIRFCESGPDYSPPSAAALLRSVVLEMIKINADGDHELQLHDGEGLVGNHDVVIGLDSRLVPFRAHLDG